MEEYYVYEYSELLEVILSYAYSIDFSTSSLERRISYSPFFQLVEKSNGTAYPIVSDSVLLETIFQESLDSKKNLNTYNQCRWAAECYIRIQVTTHLTFEAIFYYLPISKIYEMFDIYHEMDFSQIISYFNDEIRKENMLSLLMTKHDVKAKEITDKTNIPINTLYSYKTNRRKLSSMDVYSAVKLANFFNVRIESIAGIEL